MVAPAAEVRRDVRKNLPMALLILMCTVVYVLASSILIRMFESGWTFLHACYFTVINMTTIGFGDVVPITHAGKIIAGINAFSGLILFGLLAAAFTMALQPSGWEATLAPTKSASDPEHDAKEGKYPTRDAVAQRENGLADLLEGLAKIIRTGEGPVENISKTRFVTTSIVVHGRSPSHLEIDVRVRSR